MGRLDERGHYVTLIARDSVRRFENAKLMPWVDAWFGTLMNMWNRELVHAQYPAQVRELLCIDPDGSLSVTPTGARVVMGQKLRYEWGDYGGPRHGPARWAILRRSPVCSPTRTLEWPHDGPTEHCAIRATIANATMTAI